MHSLNNKMILVVLFFMAALPVVAGCADQDLTPAARTVAAAGEGEGEAGAGQEMAQAETATPTEAATATPEATAAATPEASPTAEEAATPTAEETPEAESEEEMAQGFSVAPVATPGGDLPGEPAIQLVKVADGLVDPVNVVSPQDGTGRLFVVER